MSIRVICPRCGHDGKAPDWAAGQVAPCPKCGGNMRIPGTPIMGTPVDYVQPTPSPPPLPRKGPGCVGTGCTAVLIAIAGLLWLGWQGLGSLGRLQKEAREKREARLVAIDRSMLVDWRFQESHMKAKGKGGRDQIRAIVKPGIYSKAQYDDLAVWMTEESKSRHTFVQFFSEPEVLGRWQGTGEVMKEDNPFWTFDVVVDDGKAVKFRYAVDWDTGEQRKQLIAP